MRTLSIFVLAIAAAVIPACVCGGSDAPESAPAELDAASGHPDGPRMLTNKRLPIQLRRVPSAAPTSS